MSIDLNLVKQLRDITGAGMSACKDAITQANGNLDNAIKILREKGIAGASKKSDREMKEGMCGVLCNEKFATLIKISCETDFVVKSEKFQKLSSEILQSLCSEEFKDLDSSKLIKTSSGSTIQDEIAATIGVIGENISLSNVKKIPINDGIASTYLHTSVAQNFGKIAIAVVLKSNCDKEKLKEIGKKLCMQIAATNPQFLNISDVSKDFIESEKEIYRKQMEGSDKKPEIIEKIIDGRVQKTYQECVLMEQDFVMDPKLKIKDFISSSSKELGSEIIITDFCRFSI